MPRSRSDRGGKEFYYEKQEDHITFVCSASQHGDADLGRARSELGGARTDI